MRAAALAMVVAALAGCAAGGGDRPAPVEERAGAAAPGSPDASESANPAVLALLDSADVRQREGDLERAAASLERAIQIEPIDPWLWHRLARVRLAQRQLDTAANLAARSNALSRGQRELSARNWRLIAEARAMQGRRAEAEAAAERAAQLENER